LRDRYWGGAEVKPDPWWVRHAATLAAPVMIVGTLLVFAAFAAAADAPVFAAVAAVGITITVVYRALRRRH
jgi:hypothetical protein